MRTMLAIGGQWNPLEFKFVDDNKHNQVKVMLTTGVQWRPLQLFFFITYVFLVTTCHTIPIFFNPVIVKEVIF